jgi:hypothetical protein
MDRLRIIYTLRKDKTPYSLCRSCYAVSIGEAKTVNCTCSVCHAVVMEELPEGIVNADETRQRCSACHFLAIRTSGCNHMVCLCGHEYTWRDSTKNIQPSQMCTRSMMNQERKKSVKR